MRFPKYPKYKPSGIEWLSEIPEHWEVLECKFGFSIQLGKMLQNEPQTPRDERVPYLKALYVQWESVDVTDLPEMWASPEDILKYSVQSGDLLVCEGGEVGRAGILWNSPAKCIIQNALHRVRPRKDNCSQYLMYLLEVVSYRGWFDILCNKATIAHFTSEKFGGLSIALPPPNEQRAIAAFLDRETERIDVLIKKKERQIDLLQEKRAAVISHAVTKGLDPNVKMKDSGIEWLEEIPEHWTIKRIKHVVAIRRGQVDPRTDEYSCMLLIAPNHIESRTGQLLRQETAEEQGAISGKYLFRKGDVLYSKIRPELAKACMAPEDGLCSADMYAMIPREGHIAAYVFYLLLSDAFTKLAVDESMRVAMPKINREDLGELRFPIPPESEQKQIVEYLDAQTGPIDLLLAKIQNSIELLREYRTALTTAAVTGKIDVREEVA